MRKKAAIPDRPRPLFVVRDTRQIAILGSAARQEAVDALQANGPSSVAELAAALGRAPDSLYYHLRLLERAGLVVRRSRPTADGREEALYDMPGRMVIDHEPGTTRERANLTRLARSVLRITERDLGRAIASGRAVYRRGARRNAWASRTKGWLTPAELAEVRGHLEAVAALVAGARRRPDADLHAVTFVLAPLAPTSRSRAARPSGRKSKR